MSGSSWIIIVGVSVLIALSVLENRRWEKGKSSLLFTALMIIVIAVAVPTTAFLVSGYDPHYFIYIPIYGVGGIVFLLILSLLDKAVGTSPNRGRKKASADITRDMRFVHGHNIFPGIWINRLKKALRLDSENNEAKYLLAVIYEERGKKDLANEMVEELLRVEPENPDYQALKTRIENSQLGKASPTAR